MCGRIGKLSKDTRRLIREIGEDEYWRRVEVWRAADDHAGGTLGYNVKPTQTISFVIEDGDGIPVGKIGRWGLEPRWVRDPKALKSPLFNARSESVTEKPSFRDAVKDSRCIVLADFFYEWQARPDAKTKQPWMIRRQDQAPLLLAGLWAEHDWGASFTILTTTPNELMRPIHDRMPVILDPLGADRWLDRQVKDPRAVEDLMRPCSSEQLEAQALTKAVGDWPPA